MKNYTHWILGLIILIAFTFFIYFGLYRVIKREQQNQTFNETVSDYVINKNETVIVQTLNGAIEGRKLTVFSSTIYAFMGIPYAEPPVGNLRFSSPVPIKSWSRIRSAHKFSPMCPQVIIPPNYVTINYINEDISEDCLTINIWTPDIKPKRLKTVMIWIHGGGFLYGSANFHELDGRVLASFEDVVVVTVNYRVGVFGFLNTRTREAPGNMGIYDQTLALHWIKDNIRRFGGDPQKLVPFGESAGAISIGILMSYHKTRNLFSRAITQSGSFILPQTSSTFINSVEFAKLVGCLHNENINPYNSLTDDVVACLKKADFKKLYEVSNSFLNRTVIPFMPSIDTYYEDIVSPLDYLQEDNAFSNIKEVMSGLVRDEGTFFAHMMNPNLFQKHSYPQLKTLSETRQMFIDLVTNRTDISENILSVVAKNYIEGPENDTTKKNVERLSSALGNTLIVCPTIYLADELISRNKSVYMYLFNHRPKYNEFGEWLGVVHYEEVPFVFGYPLRRPKDYSKQDISFSERIMKIWSHFAKTGEVIPQFDIIWPNYNDEKLFMVLHPNQSSIVKNFNLKSCDLYKTIIQING